MFYYFGYGSNINLASLRAKGVSPGSSEIATLRKWKLCFNVRHWFRHEGGMGNVQPSRDSTDRVQGLVHHCKDEHLPLLDAVEAYGVGYDRVEVLLDTESGPRKAVTYVGLPSHIDDACLPTRRYLNIILQGATEAGLDESYIENLRRHPLLPVKEYPMFEHPDGDIPVFTPTSLKEHPLYTGVGGAVFDMSGARTELEYLHGLFGGKDMTVFHLRRHDTSNGTETIEDYLEGRIEEGARKYLNAYLNEYAAEFRYVGKYDFGEKGTQQ